MGQTIRIAGVEDCRVDQQVICALLRRAVPEAELQQHATASAFLQALRQRQFDCLLVDLDLPDINGLKLLRQLRLSTRHGHTPIVVITGCEQASTAVQAMKFGATEYLTKGDMNVDSLRRTILAAVAACEQDRRQAERARALRFQAFTDPLTSLYNRRAFTQRLASLTSLKGRASGRFALMMIDLNDFKSVNDSFGHEAGDAVLSEVAARLRQVTRSNDAVFRLGGDEFVTVIDTDPEIADAQALARRLHKALREPVRYQDQQCYAGGGSIGVALFPVHGETAETLLAAADQAMYAAKRDAAGGVSIAQAPDPLRSGPMTGQAG